MNGIWAITASFGVADGIIDVCDISVLLFLITYLLGLGTKRRILLYGFLYVVMIGVIYYFFMIGLFMGFLSVAAILPYTNWIRYAVVIILIIWGILQLKDYFAPGKWFSLEMPHAAKARAGILISNATLASILLLGVLVGVADIPCASGWAFAYITYLVTHSISSAVALFFIFIYILFMLVPLIIAVLALYFGLVKAEAVKTKGDIIKRYLHLFTGILFIVVAILLFFIL